MRKALHSIRNANAAERRHDLSDSATSGNQKNRRGQIAVRGRDLTFDYDLATGAWSLTSHVRGRAWRWTATARVDLITPLGELDERDVASSALTSYQDLTTREGLDRHIQISRSWPDGLRVVQRFTLYGDGNDFTAEIAIRPPRNFRNALHGLSPVACPVGHLSNVHRHQSLGDLDAASCPDHVDGGVAPWRVLDVGWTAAEPARALPLLLGDEAVATGIAALAANGDCQFVVGFLDTTASVGTYRFRAVSPLDALADATAAFDTIDLGTGETTSGLLWIAPAPVDLAASRFVELWRRRHASRARLPVLVEWDLDGGTSTPSSEGEILGRLGEGRSRPWTSAIDGASMAAAWEHGPGDWTADPSRFPHGLRALRDVVRGQDLRAGIRLAPFLVARASASFQEWPASVVRSATGDPVTVGEEQSEIYAQDLTQPTVRERLDQLGNLILDTWGFDVVDVEGLDASIISGWRADGRFSSIRAYREGMRRFRDALDGRPLVARDGPLFATLDVTDAVSTDCRSLRRADPTPLLRSFLGGTGTLTGPGPMTVNADDQTVDEARAAATIASFGGGFVALADDLGALPPERGAILQACLPPFRDRLLVPLDPFADEGPCLFACRVNQHWDEYVVLIALNPSDVPRARLIALSAMGLGSDRYHAFEFWSQAYLGILSGRIVLDSIPPGGCAVVTLRAARSIPQIVGTSLHVASEAAVLHRVCFDPKECRLQFAVGARGTREGTISVALPRGWAPGPIRGTGGLFSVCQISEDVAQISLQFRDVADLELEFWPAHDGARA